MVVHSQPLWFPGLTQKSIDTAFTQYKTALCLRPNSSSLFLRVLSQISFSLKLTMQNVGYRPMAAPSPSGVKPDRSKFPGNSGYYLIIGSVFVLIMLVFLVCAPVHEIQDRQEMEC